MLSQVGPGSLAVPSVQHCYKMNPELAKQCNIILCSLLANYKCMLSTLVDHQFPSTYLKVYQMLTRFLKPPPPYLFIFYVGNTRMMFGNCRKSKCVSGSLLLLLPLVIPRKYIIDFFQQNVYYYMLDNKNNCPVNDSMKLCILDLLSCELALFSMVTYYLLFYTFYVHFK